MCSELREPLTTILDCDHVAAPATTTELFGPALTVESFDIGEQAVELANRTPFGLAAVQDRRVIGSKHPAVSTRRWA